MQLLLRSSMCWTRNDNMSLQRRSPHIGTDVFLKWGRFKVYMGWWEEMKTCTKESAALLCVVAASSNQNGPCSHCCVAKKKSVC